MNGTEFLSKACEMLPSSASALTFGKIAFKEVLLPFTSVFAGAWFAYFWQEKQHQKRIIDSELDVLIKLLVTLLNQLDQVAGTSKGTYINFFQVFPNEIRPIRLMSAYDFDSSKLSFLFVKNIELYSKMDLRLKRYNYTVTRIDIFNNIIQQEQNAMNDMLALEEYFKASIDIIENHVEVVEEIQDYVSTQYSLQSMKNFTPAINLGESHEASVNGLRLVQEKIKLLQDIRREHSE